MAKEQKAPQDELQGTAAPPPDGASQAHMIPKSRFDEVNEQRKQAQERLEALQAKIAAEEAKAKEEQGKYKELYEELQREVDALKPVKTRASELEQAIRDSNKARIDQLPESYRALVPEYDDPVKTRAWLDANASVLSAQGPTAPPLDGGAGASQRPAGGSKPPKLTALQKRVAKQAGMTEDEYARYLHASEPVEEPVDELDRASTLNRLLIEDRQDDEE